MVILILIRDYFHCIKFSKPLRWEPCLYCVLRHSVVCDFVTPWTVTYQARLTVEFSMQEYWSGLPFPTPRMLLLKVTSVDFRGGPVVKNLPASVGDRDLNPGWRRFYIPRGNQTPVPQLLIPSSRARALQTREATAMRSLSTTTRE